MFLTRKCIKISSSVRMLACCNILQKNHCRLLHRSVQHQSILSNAKTTTHITSRRISGKESYNSKSIKENLIERKPVPNSDLLEKLIAGLSSDIHQKNRVYKNDLLKVVAKVKEIQFLTKKQSLLLIRCCTELLPDESPSSRMALLEQIWEILCLHIEFDVDHYNELLRVHIANNKTLNVSTFMSKMSPVLPTITTYELILRALAEVGDLNQSSEVLSNMKTQNLPASENIINSLIICQGKSNNLNNIEDVLLMMKSLKLEKSINTYTAIARALAWNKKTSAVLEEMKKAQSEGLRFEETHVMEIIKTLAAVGEYGIVPEVLTFLPEEILKMPSISPYMQSVTTYLVYQNHPTVALEIYKCLPLPSFGPKDDRGLHGRSLVRDCVKASMPSSVLALITQELMSSGRNPIALHNASEAALQLGKVPLALDLFTRMKLLGLPIRPHYFWPIMLQNSRTYGEKGIMSTLQTMVTMEVPPDYETILEYVLPYVSFTSPQNLMKKFLDTGLTVTTVLTPMMDTLLNTGQVRAASEICELFQGKIYVDNLLKPLLKGYLTSEDVKSTIYILEDVTKKAVDKNKDWVGRFLCVFIRNKKVKADLTEFMNLVKAMKHTSLKISTGASDYCISRLPEKYSQDVVDSFKNSLTELIDDRLVDEGDMFVAMPHPKQMNEGSLRAHLNELDAKNMNTRGVLRKLLQQYCREGNLPAAKEIADRCQKEGVFLSAGMKASMFDLHVKLGELEKAELLLADLHKSSPNFSLDEFKSIDFATLMVFKKKIKSAIDYINEQSKKRRVMGGRGITMNCWRLLDAAATHATPADTRNLLELLVSLRYCQPSNSLLGPLVRAHLRSDNIQAAVTEFSRISNKYSKTPLKHELLCQILSQMGEGNSEERFVISEKANGQLNKLAQTVLNVTKKVHGAGDVQLTLIGALAEVGYKKTLRKLLLDPTVKFHPDALMRRCERFADEKKMLPLETIAECTKDLRHVAVDEIYELMLDVCQREDDHQKALRLWNRMQELNIIPSNKFVRNICSLFKANNRDIPSELILLLGKQEKLARV